MWRAEANAMARPPAAIPMETIQGFERDGRPGLRPDGTCCYCGGLMKDPSQARGAGVPRCCGARDLETPVGLDAQSAGLTGGDAPPQAVVLGAGVDPYQPGAARAQSTRALLQRLAQVGHPVVITTRFQAIARDRDVLAALAQKNLVRVFIVLGTLHAGTAGCLAPRASAPLARLEAIRQMAGAGLHVGVLVAPVIAGLTDTELESLLEAAAACGAGYADYAALALPARERASFDGWLRRCFPQRTSVVLGLLNAIAREGHTPGGAPEECAAAVAYGDRLARRFDLACRRFLLDPLSAPACCRGFQVPVLGSAAARPGVPASDRVC
jgi:hypothetical protein